MKEALSAEDVRNLYVEVLKKRDFSYEFDSDNDIVFQIKGIEIRFVVLIDTQHLEFIRICCPNFYKITSVDEVKVYKACNSANLQTKVGKVYVSPSKKTVWSAYESVVDKIDKGSIDDSVTKALVSIHLGIKNFINYIESDE